MKKAVSIILAAALAVSFTGCGKSAEPIFAAAGCLSTVLPISSQAPLISIKRPRTSESIAWSFLTFASKRRLAM